MSDHSTSQARGIRHALKGSLTRQEHGWLARMHRALERLLAAAVILAVVSLGLEYGFYEPPADFLSPGFLHIFQLAAVGVFVIVRLARLATARDRPATFKSHAFDYTLIGLGGLCLLVQFNVNERALVQAGTVYIAAMQVLILGRLGVQLVRINLELAERKVHPARLLAGSFLTVILVGAILLSLPRATRPILWGDAPHHVIAHLLNCLFTATSATCVTGLVVYDTGSDFTLFGQTVILVLIQLGGLGIMIFGGVLGLLMGRHISLRESLVLQDAISKSTVGQIGSLVKFICVTTLLFEAVGAVTLYSLWDPDITEPNRRWFLSAFHSVSAFCNAGFALQDDSLIEYRGRWQVYSMFMPLIVLGGLGFPAVQDIFVVARNRFRYRLARRRQDPTLSRRPRRPSHMSLSLHTKIVLSTSAFLIVAGALVLFVCETPTAWTARYAPPAEGPRSVERSPESMVGMSVMGRARAALFQSVTARTAGFNTIRMDTESTSPASHFALCVLMFIGGSPGSTAGGVKTVAVAVLVLGVIAGLRRRENPEVFSRTIGRDVLGRAAVVVFGMFALVTLVTFILAVTESGTLREVLFESVSACGTVGLSTGLTPRLTGTGKVVIMLAMFAGRLGPLTLLIAAAGTTRPVRYEYPTEHVVIG